MRDIIVEGFSRRQCAIADLLWNCPSRVEVDLLCRAGGPEFIVVRDILVAAVLDTVDDTDLATEALDRIFK